ERAARRAVHERVEAREERGERLPRSGRRRDEHVLPEDDLGEAARLGLGRPGERAVEPGAHGGVERRGKHRRGSIGRGPAPRHAAARTHALPHLQRPLLPSKGTFLGAMRLARGDTKEKSPRGRGLFTAAPCGSAVWVTALGCLLRRLLRRRIDGRTTKKSKLGTYVPTAKIHGNRA